MSTALKGFKAWHYPCSLTGVEIYFLGDTVKRIKVGALISTLLLVSLAFQNCSDVEFAKIEDSISLGCGPGEALGLDGICRELQTRITTTTVQAPVSAIDIFLVVDNSGSMDADLARLSTRMAGFVQLLESSGLDWQACYTTTDMTTSSGAKGNALKWRSPTGASTNEIVLNSSSAANFNDLDARFTRSIQQFASQSNGSGTEQGIAALSRAVDLDSNQSCFRDTAALVSIVISDEDERSCGGRTNVPEGTPHGNDRDYTEQCSALGADNIPANLIEKVLAKWPDKNYQANSLVIKPNDMACWDIQDIESRAYFGVTYNTLTVLTGGIPGNICADDYADELADISQNINNLLSSITLECAPYAVTSVTIDNQPAPSATYALQGNKMVFTPSLPEGSVVVATYECVVPN